ncbi:hypothetical protein KM043_011906 [Ampulex compressa]|nr:hypothetical protein KM043_011906 [Ampulex compressa]
MRGAISADYDCVKTAYIVRIVNMLLFGVLATLLVAASAEFCYNDVEGACSSRPLAADGSLLPKCNANFEFLLMSTHFGNYEANREGFKELYRKYSDKLWEDAIDVIKYITKRGGKMNFNQPPRFKKSVKDSRVVELNEINSLAKALDSQKQLADEALRIHAQAQPHNKHDAAVAHYIEEHFVEQHADHVRDLSGYTNDLKNLLGERDASVSMFLFDELLKKSL